MQVGCAGHGQGPRRVVVLSKDLGLSAELSPQLPEQLSQQREQPVEWSPSCRDRAT